ncbi:sulfotransferase family protein [uncultured Roseovarius sp.]|uniref:tetratricopeptide repeat-containing sulfotransferase family protein n=1 Tax=uncultured Roseovarius sp. TaxID=293344 RepID=UPI0026302DD1|nr:sulfotransferase family protein [uncultured Roseovarius sp.]
MKTSQALANDLPESTYDVVRKPVHAFLQRQEFKPALEILLKVQDFFPNDARLLDDMAICYWRLGDQETSIQLIRQIVEISPTDPSGWGRLGAMTLSVGDTQSAEQAFSQLLKLTPRSVSALAALNLIKVFDRKSHRARTLRNLAESKGLNPTDKATALNALGRIEDAAGNHRIAFRFFARSKQLVDGAYDAEMFDQRVADQKHLFKGGNDALTPVASDAPRFAFIVGLPRSGTTLVERILCRHTNVHSIGESQVLPTVLTACREQVAKEHGLTGRWDWVAKLTAQQIDECRTLHTKLSLQGFTQTPAPVIVDKLPLNCFEIGFAKTILPDAKFIFMSRHPLDVGLSNFMTNFDATHAFSKRLDTIGHLTRAVYASLEDYEGKIGAALRRQSYSALVTDTEAQIRGLLDHVGLPWDPVCLSPEQGDEIVRTASVMQVRAPINTAALAKWKRYETELAPLVDALGGWNWIENWQAADAACAKAAK